MACIRVVLKHAQQLLLSWVQSLSLCATSARTEASPPTHTQLGLVTTAPAREQMNLRPNRLLTEYLPSSETGHEQS